MCSTFTVFCPQWLVVVGPTTTQPAFTTTHSKFTTTSREKNNQPPLALLILGRSMLSSSLSCLCHSPFQCCTQKGRGPGVPLHLIGCLLYKVCKGRRRVIYLLYNDYRHHIYKKAGPKEVELKEVGPRFELRRKL